ncbi:hypothetical protein AYI69_g2327 [Smittium culicis]|uniref:Uncharacterized protein n=1 Tax=Smittium culicis TaxID=133412 RepID=A0A1R1YMV0_9FUNG|nr:hypothetical protein AYI69_g2327 [Smittium culicis]
MRNELASVRNLLLEFKERELASLQNEFDKAVSKAAELSETVIGGSSCTESAGDSASAAAAADIPPLEKCASASADRIFKLASCQQQALWKLMERADGVVPSTRLDIMFNSSADLMQIKAACFDKDVSKLTVNLAEKIRQMRKKIISDAELLDKTINRILKATSPSQ